ncbi:MAG: hypothetical protein MUO22_05300, partial [Sedimentisphaerales bacterium]|nr:hypothetical protein [Sedimentisphaerales bacterium]
MHNFDFLSVLACLTVSGFRFIYKKKAGFAKQNRPIFSRSLTVIIGRLLSYFARQSGLKITY